VYLFLDATKRPPFYGNNACLPARPKAPRINQC